MPEKINKNPRIAITGIGPISAIGIGKEEVWDSILKGKTGLSLDEYSVAGSAPQKFYTHKINNFNLGDFGISKNILDDITSWKEEGDWLDLAYILAVIKLAISDSKLDFNPEDTKNSIGLVVAHENPGLDDFYRKVIDESYDLLKKDNSLSKEKYFSDFFGKFQKRAYDLQTFMYLFHIAKSFGIHGYSLFVNNACASGLYALEAGSEIIKSGKCKSVIVAGVDRASIFKLFWFKGINTYPDDGKIKPFAKNRNGFVFGEGGAGLVLENLEDALARGAHIYAEYLGGGFNLEGWKVTVSDLTSDSYRNALLEVLNTADLNKDAVDLLVPHGVGTTVTDAYEARAISDIFGKNTDKPIITALKPYVGHNLGSCCLLELAILFLALENEQIPPTLNVDEIDKTLNINLLTALKKKNFNTFVKTACGFAGYNGACAFRKVK